MLDSSNRVVPDQVVCKTDKAYLTQAIMQATLVVLALAAKALANATPNTTQGQKSCRNPYIHYHCPVCTGAISPGVPATFLANYKAGIEFLEGLEAYCSSSAALGAFRSCYSYTSFTKRWKLSIYFSTRFQVRKACSETSNSLSLFWPTALGNLLLPGILCKAVDWLKCTIIALNRTF